MGVGTLDNSDNWMLRIFDIMMVGYWEFVTLGCLNVGTLGHWKSGAWGMGG